MRSVATWLARLVGALHVLIGCGEIFATRLLVSRFGFVAEVDEAMAVVRNAGLYNLFLATTIFWALRQPERNRPLIVLCLGFVVVAGVFGAVTLERPIVLVLQPIPAVIALIALRR